SRNGRRTSPSRRPLHGRSDPPSYRRSHSARRGARQRRTDEHEYPLPANDAELLGRPRTSFPPSVRVRATALGLTGGQKPLLFAFFLAYSADEAPPEASVGGHPLDDSIASNQQVLVHVLAELARLRMSEEDRVSQREIGLER